MADLDPRKADALTNIAKEAAKNIAAGEDVSDSLVVVGVIPKDGSPRGVAIHGSTDSAVVLPVLVEFLCGAIQGFAGVPVDIDVKVKEG